HDELSDLPTALRTRLAVEHAEPRLLLAVGAGERAAEDLNPAHTANTTAPLSTALVSPPSARRSVANVCGASSPPPSTYRSQDEGPWSTTGTRTSSASIPRQRNRCVRTTALPPSP